MRLIVPYAQGKLRSETVEALQVAGLEPEYRRCQGDRGYWELLDSLWGRCKDDLVIVEQDIVVNPGSVADLVACPEHWCAFRYQYAGRGLAAGLGCVKFSRWIQERGDNVMQRVGDMPGDKLHPRKHWCRLDIQIAQEVGAWHVSRHIHQPPVGHLGNGQAAHGCL